MKASVDEALCVGWKEETRVKRLGKLIEDSGGGRTLPQFARKSP